MRADLVQATKVADGTRQVTSQVIQEFDLGLENAVAAAPDVSTYVAETEVMLTVTELWILMIVVL